MAADARLENEDELRLRLPRQATDSVAALILEAYRQWGAECVHRLQGDFAFVVWDDRARILFCARDGLGIRPFYYHHFSGGFYFATSVTELLEFAGVPGEINRSRVIRYLQNHHEDLESTFYRYILRLQPGHTATISPDGMRQSRYWQLDPQPGPDLRSDSAYVDRYRDLFTRSVQSRLQGVGNVGALLSGGLDSSSVACTARTLMDGVPLDTFSLVFEDLPRSDERKYIDAVTSSGGFRPHIISGLGSHPLEDIDNVLRRLGEPFFTPNLFLHRLLWKECASHDVRIVLDGFLGDQVVGHGTRHLTELAYSGRWFRFARELRAAASHQKRPRRALIGFLRQFVIDPLRPPTAISAGFVRRELAVCDVTPRTPRSDREENLREVLSDGFSTAIHVAERAAAEFGIEPRFPFADRGLVEFCISVPARLKCRDGWTRAYARDAMADRLPDAVRHRYGKANIGPAFRRCMMANARDEVTETLAYGLTPVEEYVDVDAIRAAWDRLIGNTAAPSYDVLLNIWLCVVLARWMRVERSHIRSKSGEFARGPLSDA